MSFYEDMRATAAELLDEFGQDVTLTKNTRGPYDPAARGATLTPSTSTRRAAVFNYEQRDIDGTNIRQGDQHAIMSGLPSTVTPEVGDTLTVGGVNFALVKCEPLQPAGLAVIYEAQLRASAEVSV